MCNANLRITSNAAGWNMAFLRVRCESCHATWLPSVGRSCASMLFLDGVYVDHPNGTARFRWVKAPTSQELTQLAHTIAHRVGRFLERQGLLERDAENSYLASDAGGRRPDDATAGAFDHLPHRRRPQAGRKVFTLQTLPACDEPFDDGVGKVAGFSLHAGVAARADERKKLERLCRYISRPAVSEKRLSLTPNGNIRYQLKTPYRDGTTHVIFEPLDFIARLAALVPKPRVNLTRFHGVFAPNSKHRALVTPAKRGKGNKPEAVDEPQERTPAERRASMTWAQRLKRVFNIDIETCRACGGAVQGYRLMKWTHPTSQAASSEPGWEWVNPSERNGRVQHEP